MEADSKSLLSEYMYVVSRCEAVDRVCQESHPIQPSALTHTVSKWNFTFQQRQIQKNLCKVLEREPW